MLVDVHMYSYSNFWKVISTTVQKRYKELLSYMPDDGAIYSGPDRFIYDPDGGLATHFKKAQNKSVANFYFLPVSPLYLCAAALSANHTGPYNVENIVNRFRFGTRGHMSQAYQGRVSEGLFCNTYLRLLRWVERHSHFNATAKRHIWHFSHSFFLTSAIFRGDNRTNAKGLRMAFTDEDPYRVMRPGIFLTQEHRVGAPPPNVVIIPFYSPRYFHVHASNPRLTLLTSSSHHSTACHRFDHYPRGGGKVWSCEEEAVRHSGAYRKALEIMTKDLNATVSLRQAGAVPSCPQSVCGRCTSARCPNEALQYKAKMYKDSIYCVVVPGDSLITPRIFSYVQAGCILLFPYTSSLLPTILPFPRSIPWTKISISLNLRAVSNWAKGGYVSDENPLRSVLFNEGWRYKAQLEERLLASRLIDYHDLALSSIALELSHVDARYMGARSL